VAETIHIEPTVEGWQAYTDGVEPYIADDPAEALYALLEDHPEVAVLPDDDGEPE
jgi:hypothetical protein